MTVGLRGLGYRHRWKICKGEGRRWASTIKGQKTRKASGLLIFCFTQPSKSLGIGGKFSESGFLHVFLYGPVDMSTWLALHTQSTRGRQSQTQHCIQVRKMHITIGSCCQPVQNSFSKESEFPVLSSMETADCLLCIILKTVNTYMMITACKTLKCFCLIQFIEFLLYYTLYKYTHKR